MTGEAAGDVPLADLHAIIEGDSQGWAIAEAVRVDGEIVDFRLVHLNQAGARFVGRPRDELLGRRYRELWPETVNDGTLPLYRRVVETREPAVRTVFYDRATLAGHFELRIAPFGDGFVVCFVDLAQITLQPVSAAGPRLYDVLDAAFDGFMLLRAEPDAHGVITDFTCAFVNQIGAKLSGRSAEEVIGRRVRDFAPRGVELGLLDRCVDVLVTGEPWRSELPVPDTDLIWELKISRTDQNHVAVSYRDVTGQLRQQERIAHSESQARHAAERTAALQAVTAALVAAGTPAEVYAVMGALVRPSAGGHGLLVLVRDEGRIALSYHTGYDPTAIAGLNEIPVYDQHPAAVAVRTGAPLFYATPEEFAAALPMSARAAVVGGGRQAWAFLPLATAGRVIGVMVLGYRDQWALEKADRDILAAFSGLCAQALQRALLFEAQRSIAADLQRALLPAALPDLRGARHAVRYLPWTHGADVGGDWYDVIPLAPDAVAVVIGDVAGHSPTAAATMGQIRNALRAYAAEGHSPTGVMERVNRLLLRVDPEAVATCCYLEVHLAEGTATAVLAGHPPPVLHTAGVARPLSLRVGPPLGVEVEAGYTDTTILLPTGSNLVLYTDGLVEDRRYDIDRGVADLCAAVARAPSLDPQVVVDHILTADVGPYPRSDDVAILSLTVDAPAPLGPARAERSFGGDAASAPAARRFAADILTAWGESGLVDNARLLLGEVITNAVQHTVGDVSVRLTLGARRLRVEVGDRSDRQPDRRAVGADSESGRGLHIVQVLAQGWGHEPQPSGGKVVWFELARTGA